MRGCCQQNPGMWTESILSPSRGGWRYLGIQIWKLSWALAPGRLAQLALGKLPKCGYGKRSPSISQPTNQVLPLGSVIEGAGERNGMKKKLGYPDSLRLPVLLSVAWGIIDAKWVVQVIRRCCGLRWSMKVSWRGIALSCIFKGR